MSGVDFNVDYDKQAKEADDMINKIAQMAQSGDFAVKDEGDLAVDDTISVNSKDLEGLDQDEMDDAEMERMINGDFDDGELNELMDDGDMSDFDMDDPKALEKLEAAEKRQAEKKASATAKPTQTPTQPQPTAKPVAARPVPTKPAATPTTPAKPTATTAPPPAVKPAAAHTASETTTTPSQPATTKAKLTPAELKARNDEYDVVIKNVQENITDITTFMERQKDPALSQKYLPLINQSKGYLKTLTDGKKAQEPVPPYKFVQLSAKKEKKNEDIGTDDVRVTVVNMINVKSTAKYSCKVILGIGKEQSQTTKQVKGKDVVEFNQDLTFTLSPANIRASQNGLKLCKLGRGSIELHSHGMLWGSTIIGKGDIKISPLQTKIESIQTIKIKDDDDEVVCELELKLAVNRPFVTPEVEDTTTNIVKLGSHAPAPELKPVEPIKTTAGPAATATATKPAVTPAVTPAATKPTSNSTPATAGTTTPTAAATTPVAPIKEKDPDDMSIVEIIKASGFGLNQKVFGTLGEFPTFVGLEVLTWERNLCEQMLKTKQFKRRMDEYAIESRIQDCKLRQTVLETQVGSGKLELPQYIELLRGQIGYEQTLMDETLKVAKWYKSKGKEDDAKYYAELYTWFKGRKDTTQTELEGAEAMGEGDDEEEE